MVAICGVVCVVCLLAIVATQAPDTDSDEDSYQIYVKKPCGNTITLEVAANDTINNVKYQIKALEGIPPKQQRLIFGDTQLEDGKKLADYKIVDGSEIQLVQGSVFEAISYY